MRLATVNSLALRSCGGRFSLRESLSHRKTNTRLIFHTETKNDNMTSRLVLSPKNSPHCLRQSPQESYLGKLSYGYRLDNRYRLYKNFTAAHCIASGVTARSMDINAPIIHSITNGILAVAENTNRCSVHIGAQSVTRSTVYFNIFLSERPHPI